MDGIEEKKEKEEAYFIDGIDKDSLKSAIEMVDKTFEKNIGRRESLNRKWADLIEMGIFGQSKSNTTEYSSRYTNLDNPLYPSSLRSSVAQDLSWLDGDFFRLVPSGVGVVDTTLVKSVEAYIKQSLKNERYSRFVITMEKFLTQLRLFNISAVRYSYITRLKGQKKLRLESDENGYSKVVMVESGDRKLAYQGAQAEFINMLSCYPDITDPMSSSDINNVDVYLKEPASISSLLSDERFDPTKPYAFHDFVIYRNNLDLHAIKDNKYSMPDDQKELRAVLDRVDIPRPDGAKDGFVELRSAYLKELRIKQNNSDEPYKICENVIAFYAKDDTGDCIPLLVEYNHREFSHKDLFIMQETANPYDMYGKSNKALAYNHASWFNFVRAASAEAIGEVYRGSFYPEELESASAKSGISPDKFKAALDGVPGMHLPYKASNPAANPAGIIRTQGIVGMRDLPALRSELEYASREIDALQVDLQNVDASSSTATGINYVNSKQMSLYRKHLRSLSVDILVPFIESFISDLGIYLQQESVSIDIGEKDILESSRDGDPDLEAIKAQFLQTGQPILNKRLLKAASNELSGNQQILSTEINPLTRKEYVTLTKDLVEALEMSVEIEIENNDYDKAIARQEMAELWNLIQSIGDETGDLSHIAIMKYLDLVDKRYKPEFEKAFAEMKRMKQEQMQAQAQLQQEQAALAQAQQVETQQKAVKLQADTQKSLAEGEEEQSRADRQKMENTEIAQEQINQRMTDMFLS